jgi:hypothetical protein
MDIVQNLSFNYASPSFVSYRTYPRLSLSLCIWDQILVCVFKFSLSHEFGAPLACSRY